MNRVDLNRDSFWLDQACGDQWIDRVDSYSQTNQLMTVRMEEGSGCSFSINGREIKNNNNPCKKQSVKQLTGEHSSGWWRQKERVHAKVKPGQKEYNPSTTKMGRKAIQNQTHPNSSTFSNSAEIFATCLRYCTGARVE